MSSSVIVALAIIFAFVVLGITTMLKYTANEAIRVLGVFTGMFGLVIGAMGTYFFTRTEVDAARSVAVQYKDQLAKYASTAAQAKTELVNTIDSKPATYTLRELKEDPGYKAAVTKFEVVDGAKALNDDLWRSPNGDSGKVTITNDFPIEQPLPKHP